MKTISRIILVLSVIMAVYMMMNHMGLDDGLDFGAGAYYYADIPEFDKYVNADAYSSPVPFWIIALLFLLWGWIVYKLWTWLK